MNIFKEKNVKCVLLTSTYNRAWISDYPSTYGFIFYQPDKITYFLDSRYYTEANAKFKNDPKVSIKLLTNVRKQLGEFFDSLNLKELGFEDFYCTIKEFEQLKLWIPKAKFIPIGGPNLRIKKTPAEVKRVEGAINVTLQALHNIKKVIKEGVSEKEIAVELEAEMKRLGARKESFDTIVASGPRGAMPHGVASERILKAGEWVTIDFGALYKNYCADITRTIRLEGKHYDPKIDAKLKEIYPIVKEAQRRGIAKVKAGVLCSDIDAACRDYIESKGYGQYFQHGTGHGLGVEIHEEPYVTKNSPFGALEAGQIVTVEPGIYLPGIGGVRIEDDILVEANGHRVLGNLHELIEKDFNHD